MPARLRQAELGRGWFRCWAPIHTIGQYARHLGHADLLRDWIDGALGLQVTAA